MTAPRDIDLNDPSTYVVCELCGVKQRSLTRHLDKVHGIAANEYRKLFPQSLVICSHRSEEQRKETKARWAAGSGYREHMEEVLVKARESFLSDPENVRRRGEAISKSRKGQKKSEEHKRKLSEAAKKQWANMGGDERKEFCAKRAEACRESELFHKTHADLMNRVRPTPEQSSLSMAKAIREGRANPRHHSISTKYKGVWMRSKLEAIVASHFDSMGFEWQHEPVVIELPDGRGYVPDFYIPDLATYFEVKGYADGENTKKARLAWAVVITSKDVARWNKESPLPKGFESKFEYSFEGRIPNTNAIFITAFGKRQVLADWAREKNLPYETLRHRIQYLDWPIERALTEPLNESKSKIAKSRNNNNEV